LLNLESTQEQVEKALKKFIADPMVGVILLTQ
jgi:hypothetical protein